MEIEIKARFSDKEKVEARLKNIKAKEEKKKHQIDEYYNHPQRDTRKTNEYIRLRLSPASKEGVFAYHLNLRNGVNKEYEVKVDDVDTFKKILELSGFQLLGIIDKKRKAYTFKNFTITVDEVKDVGNFVEVETDGEEHQIDEKKAGCLAVLEKIGLSKKDLCEEVWLCDIATGKNGN